MTLSILMLLIALAVLLAWRECLRSSRVLAGVALIFFLAVGCGPLPSMLLGSLQADVSHQQPIQWGQRNVIVLLGAGTVRVDDATALEASLFSYGRINKAVALYRSCKDAARQCKLEVSGGDARGLGQSEAEVYATNIRQLGVANDDLLLEGRSMNTWQNAQFSKPMLKAVAADRIWLVSSGFHLRRAQLYFRHFGINATPVRADYISAEMSWLPLSYNFTMADLALHEYVGIARYYVYNMMGWNVTATKPGAM